LELRKGDVKLIAFLLEDEHYYDQAKLLWNMSGGYDGFPPEIDVVEDRFGRSSIWRELISGHAT